jgi:hypothetical protein
VRKAAVAPGNSLEVAGPKIYILMVHRTDMTSYKYIAWEPEFARPSLHLAGYDAI